MTREFKVSDFLLRIKNQININDAVKYKRVTVSGNHKGVSMRDEVLGSAIGTKKQFTIKGGDFILSKIDARNGAFGIIPDTLDNAIITGNFWTYSVNNNLIDTEWFFYFTHSYNFIQICIESSTGSTHRKYLNEKVFLNHKIILPEIEEQKEMVKRYKTRSKISNNLTFEINSQKELLSKLKQSILQEAIQGKLTADWRKHNLDTESANNLLKRIKAEKAQLVKNKKIKKEKALPPITEEEIPYKLPKKWVWCRLGETLLYSDAGKSPQCEKRPAINNEWGVLTTTAIQKGCFIEKANKVLPSNFKINLGQKVESGDILITRAGPLNRTGISCKVGVLKSNLILSDKTIRLKQIKNFMSPDFIVSVLNSKSIRSLLIPSMTGMAESQVNISQGNIKKTPFPLPPIDEQKAIVEKVKALMQKCQALEKEIDISKANAKVLMQAVLKEVFENKEVSHVAES